MEKDVVLDSHGGCLVTVTEVMILSFSVKNLFVENDRI